MTTTDTTPAVAELRGLPLLDAVIAHIEAHPETWNQGDYRCETGMCVAGWAVELTGGTWANPVDDVLADYVKAVPEDDPSDVFHDRAGLPCVVAADRAVWLLNLDDDQAESLFAGDNTLERIREVRDGIAQAQQ